MGEEATVHIHTHVREDAIQFFGFHDGADKTMFTRLTSVSGIGPKLAVNAFSIMSAMELQSDRRGRREGALSISGGKKTAQRIVLELAERVKGLDVGGLALGAGAVRARRRASEICAPRSATSATPQSKRTPWSSASKRPPRRAPRSKSCCARRSRCYAPEHSYSPTAYLTHGDRRPPRTRTRARERSATTPRAPEVEAESQDADRFAEPALRPKSFADYAGQRAVKQRLEVAVRAARMRGEALDHVLLAGPPGLGKTTLAAILAAELGVTMHATSGPAIEKKETSRASHQPLAGRRALHRRDPSPQRGRGELYPAMEDFHIDILIGDGAHAEHPAEPPPLHARRRDHPQRAPHPLLRGRFGILENLEFYEVDDLARIVRRLAFDMLVDDDACTEIARRSRGTPRIANRMLRRVRDYRDVEGCDVVDVDLARHALTQLDIDELGFDRMDRKYLSVIVEMFQGGPVGLDTIAAAMGESAHSLEDVYEPFLIQNGFIKRTPRGRVATQRAFDHLGALDRAGQAALFRDES